MKSSRYAPTKPGTVECRSAALTCCLFALLLLGVASCSTTQEVPLDVKPSVSSGDTAKSRGDYSEAILHFSSALDRYPNLASARLARGECHLALADATSDPKLRTAELHEATLDFAEAITHGTGTQKLTAYLQAGATYERLGQRERALELYKSLRDDPGAEPWALIVANRRSGELLLATLHERYAVDEPIPVNGDLPSRELARRAIYFFEETLHHDPDDFAANLGKGICLIHERDRHASEPLAKAHSLAETGLSGATDVAQSRLNLLRATYLLAVAREHDLGINRESNDMYLAAVRLDDSHDSTPVYHRLLRRLSESHQVEPATIVEIVEAVANYEGSDRKVWRSTVAYLKTRDQRQPAEILASAIAHARLGDIRQAYSDFVTWWSETSDADHSQAETAIERVFRVANGERENELGTLALSRAKAYRIAFPPGTDYAKRLDVWNQLRATIELLAGDPIENASPGQQRRQCAVLSAYLSEEILANLPKAKARREELLNEARELTHRELSFSENSAAAELRLGKIETKSDRDASLLGYAERAIERDPSRSFDEAYDIVGASYKELDRSDVSENDRAKRDRLADQLADYQGTNPDTIALRERILEERRVAKAQAAKEKARQEKQDLEDEHAKTFRECPHCFVDVKKTLTTCSACGDPLPPLVSDDGGL